MTDMDWAEEEFHNIYRSILNDHLEVSKPLVLAALRKAKADGIRMAASLRDSSDYDSLFLFREAVKIEQGLASIIENVATSTDQPLVLHSKPM